MQLFRKHFRFNNSKEQAFQLPMLKALAADSLHFCYDIITASKAAKREIRRCLMFPHDPRAKYSDYLFKNASGKFITVQVRNRNSDNTMSVELRADRSSNGRIIIEPGWLFGNQDFIAVNYNGKEWWCIKPVKLCGLVMEKIRNGDEYKEGANQPLTVRDGYPPFYIKNTVRYKETDIKQPYTPYSTPSCLGVGWTMDLNVNVPLEDIKPLVAMKFQMSDWGDEWLNHITYSDGYTDNNGRFACDEYVEAKENFFKTITAKYDTNGVFMVDTVSGNYYI